jgi:hypothetical protein
MHLFLDVIIFAALGAVMVSAGITVKRWQYWAILACCMASGINAALM